MRRSLSLFVMLMLCGVLAFSQNRVVTGTVTDDNGTPISGATIKVKGSRVGTAADVNGNYSISVPAGATLVVSGVGVTTKEIAVGNQTSLNVSVIRSSAELNTVVVTALGIRKTRNELTYAAQQVLGDEVNKQRSSNFINNLSGKVSGLELRQSNTLGGSTNINLRGNKTIGSSNQPLFVVDGVPFDNSTQNSSSQRTGTGGYDYGNAAADINPDDIESITVLKGAGSTALYGSRGGNGVILITTKSGKSRKGLGVTLNSGFTYGSIDKSTFLKYQKEYGGGYGNYYEDPTGFFLFRDPNQGFNPTGGPGDRLVVPTSEDASYGGRFDPNLMVFNWNAFDPSSPFFHKATPWVAAENDPSTFFEKSYSSNQNISVDGGSDKGNFKMGYTRTDDRGILPNSHIHKNLFNFGSTYNLTEKLTAGASVNFSNIDGLGRYGTGYDGSNGRNVAGNFRQWWQTNVDIKELKAAYDRTGKNVTWNPADPTDLTPIYWNNPYFTRYQDYENDTRNRYFGNFNLNYKLTSWLNVLGRVGLDNYAEILESRQPIGSVGIPHYTRYNHSFNETNFDLLFTADKNITTGLNLKGLLGGNIRKNHEQSVSAATNGGLVVPGIFALSNTLNPINAPSESDLISEVNGIFAGATLSYRNTYTLDGTIRRDESSTLPKGNNTYYYPSVSAGIVFSKLIPSANWLTYGKIRGNYAQVGNDTRPYRTSEVYDVGLPFGSNPQYSVPGTATNPALKPERTKSYEGGIEASFFKGRFGFDASYYDAKTFDQIFAVSVSTATGNSSKFLNSGTVQNKGVELSVYGTPVKTKNFSWDIRVNYTRNRNKVLDLYTNPGTGVPTDNIVLGSFQGGVSVNATLGQPYGTIRGSNFVYTNGQKTVKANGRYLLSPTSNEVIGDPNPDWIGGINNTVKYKNLSLSWLIDVRQGGDLFSLDLYYGLATGLYPETAGLNDLGNPKRSPVLKDASGNYLPTSGGIIREGVTADGKANIIRASGVTYGLYGYRYSPAAGFIYDASYVKLREAILTYSLPTSIINKLHSFKGIDLSLIGRNLWIIHKNLPYADPEEIVSAGNLQGYQVGAYPTTRTFTLNLKLKF